LNELRHIPGDIYANVWRTNRVARSDALTRRSARLDRSRGLLNRGELEERAGVLNGIAYGVEGDRRLVTGKLGPKLFHIEMEC
jgi:glutaminyl-peptide cyclotransferase